MNKWTIEKLQEEANKYKTRGEFQRKNSSAYSVAFNKNLINDLFKNHLDQGYERKHKKCWTIDILQEYADECKTIGEFQKKNCAAYYAAKRQNLIDKLFQNHNNKGYYKNNKRPKYWNFNTLKDVANMCNNRNDLKKNYVSAYYAATKRNLMDELFKNHINQGYINKDNNYVVYVYEIIDFNKAYVGLTNDIKRRDIQHLFSSKENLMLFCNKKNIPLPKYKILNENLNSIDAKKLEKSWYDYYKNNNWEMFNVAKTGSLGGIYKYSKTQLQIEANKYKTRYDFIKNNNKMFYAAKNRKLLNELFKNHYNNGYLESRKWNLEKMQKEANKYKTRKEFRENNFKAYRAAYTRNLLNELFKNHIDQGYILKTKKPE